MTLPEPESTNGKPGHRCAVIIPTTQNLVFPLARWMLEQLKDAPAFTVSLLQHMSAGYVEDMRQALTEGFLAGCSAPWLLMVDSDTVPRLSARQMVDGAEAAGVQIVLSPVPLHGKHGGIYSNLYRLDERGSDYQLKWHKMPWEQKERYLPLHSGGLACALIHRDVLATMVDDARKGRAPWPMRGAWKDGRLVLSEDLAFCSRARRRGFKLYADLDNTCSHVKAWAMTPQQAIEDLPFHEPLAAPHPQAPRSMGIGPMATPAIMLRSSAPKDYDKQDG